MLGPLAAVMAVGFVVAPLPALACGAAISRDGSVELDQFYGLLVHDGSTESLTVTVDYRTDGPAEAFGWMMPFPNAPQISAGSLSAIKEGLEMTAAPTMAPAGFFHGFGSGVGAPPPVEVLGTAEVGNLQFVTLAGSDASALGAWLRTNGFQFDDVQSTAIQSYLNRGWVLVAARAEPGSEPSGRLQAVEFSFPSGKPVMPLAIAQATHSGTMRMSLLVVTPYRPHSVTYPERTVHPDLEGDFSAPGSDAELRYSARLTDQQRGLLAVDALQIPNGAWISRYESSWQLTALTQDLVLDRATSQSPVDFSALLEQQQQAQNMANLEDIGLIVLVGIAVAAPITIAAVLAVVLITRRRRRMAR